MIRSQLRALAILSAATMLPAQGVQEALEPNDTPATATILQPGEQGYGELTADPIGDRDLFQFTLSAPSDVRLWTAPGFTNPVGDTRLALCDALGNVVTEIDDGSVATHGYYSILSAGSLAAGTWHLRVRGWDPSYVGSYTVDLIAAPPGTYAINPALAPMSEVVEPNDPREPGVATPTSVDSRNTGTITAGGADGAEFDTAGSDYDFYSFVVSTLGVHELSTEATPTVVSPPRVDDTVLFLVDASLNILAQNDDFGPSTYSRVTFDIQTPGTYHAVVKGYFATSAGDYVLDIQGPQPPLPDVQSTTIVHPGGCPGTNGPVTLGLRGNSFGFTVSPEQPLLGSSFVLDLRGAPADAVLLRAMAITPAVTPIDLTPAGAPGCSVEVDGLIDLGFCDGNGDHWWIHRTPVILPLLGLTLEQQVAVLDLTNNLLGVSLTNRVSTVLGTRH